MAKNLNHISHKKSKSKNLDGSPKLPSPSVLVEGEIAINFAENVETLSVKNESGNVVTFSSDDYYTKKKLGGRFTNNNVTVTDSIEELEEAVSSSLNDLDERKLDASAYTPTDLTNYYTKSETSGATEISNALGTKVDKSWIEEKLGSGFTGDNSANTVTSVIEENEEIISTALNDLNDRLIENTTYTNGHEYVDLGLPSGTKWATMNVGASSETDYGNYYQYGKGAAQYAATSGDSNYSGTEDPLDSSVDTAAQVWGGSWHMPTRAQMQELTANTTYQWVTNYKGSGINGGTFTATNGAVLFFPAAGFWDNGSQYGVGTYGLYWGSSPDGSNGAYGLDFSDGGKDVSGNYRKFGYSVRPVIDTPRVKDIVDDLDAKSKKEGETLHYLTEMTGVAGGTNTAAIWSGYSSEITELYTGLCVRFIIPSAGHASGDTLVINDGEQHTIFYNTDTKLTTHYPTGSVLNLTYDADTIGKYYSGSSKQASVQGVWRANAEFYKDTNTDTIGYTIGHNAAVYKTDKAAYRYMILLQKDETTLTPLNTTSKSTGGTKVLTTSEFDPFGEIIYKSSTATTAAGAVIPTGVTWTQSPVNLAYSFNTTDTLVFPQSIYMVTVPQSNGKVVLHSSPISQTLPTTEDGLVYIYLGQAYSETNIFLMNNHPAYCFKNGKLRRYTGADDLEDIVGSGYTNTTITEVIENMDTAIAAALNDLNGRKLDASAYTPTDLSNYYTKDETSGATELQTALAGKSGTGHTHASSAVTAMTSYAKAASGSSITTSDTLNQAIGKLEAYVDDLNSKGVVSAVTVSSNLNNVVCPSQILGNEMSGAQADVIYVNSGTTTDYTITVSTTYKTPDGNQLNLTCPKNGYCEISYLNINGTIYARGI